MPTDRPNIPHNSGTRTLLPAGIILTTVLALHAGSSHGIEFYAAVFLLSSGVYVWLAKEILKAELSKSTLLLLLGLALLVRASFLFTVPLGSDDVFRYLWDGKVQAAGIDPYRYAPDAPELAALSSNLLPAAVNHPEMKSVYFPVSQWVFFLSYRLGGEAVWGFKLFLLLAEALTLTALWQLASIVGFPRTRVLLYALCPLPIVQFAYDAHLDGLGIPFLAFAFVFYLTQKPVRSMLLLGVSLAIKPVALVLLPVFLLSEKSMRGRLCVLILPCVPFGLQFVPYLPSSNPLEGLLTFSRHWTFNGVAFEAVNALVSNNLPSRLVCAGCLALSLLLLYRSSIGQIRKMYLAVLLLLVFSPVVHPWYVCWMLVFLPPVRPWSGIIYAATASLTVFTIVGYRSSGVWGQHPLALLGEYLPVLVVLVMELWRWRRGAATT